LSESFTDLSQTERDFLFHRLAHFGKQSFKNPLFNSSPIKILETKQIRNSYADSQDKHNPHIQQSLSPLQLKTSISNAISKQATAFDSKFTIISNI